jgi:IrrE N-terminal-like domain
VANFRRGFKSWSERVSLGFRRDLGLDDVSALDPRILARHLNILVWTPEEVARLGGLDQIHLDQLLVHDTSSWSAVTLFDRSHRLVVVNSKHVPVRQNSDIMHEIAHMVLEHEPARVDMTEKGLLILDSYDKAQESEADWLAGALLVPRDPLLFVLSRNSSTASAASQFNVSNDMIKMRRQMTGIDIQLRRRTTR